MKFTGLLNHLYVLWNGEEFCLFWHPQAMSSGRFATNIHNLHKEDCVLYGSQNANQAVADQLKELINAGLVRKFSLY